MSVPGQNVRTKPDANRDAKTDAKSVAHPDRLAWSALFAFAVVVGASAFALTYQGLYGYGRDLAHLGGFAWLVPVAIDGATMFAVAATFMLAGKPWHVRAYAWLVFAVMNGLSIAGNLSHAVERHLPWQGALGSATWPGVMTLVAHLGVVVWRHCRPGNSVPSRRSIPPPPPAAVAPQGTKPVVPGSSGPRPAPPATNNSAPPVGSDQKTQARSLYAAGVGVTEILRKLDGKPRTPRTINNWTADLRDQHASARAARLNGASRAAP